MYSLEVCVDDVVVNDEQNNEQNRGNDIHRHTRRGHLEYIVT